MFQAKCADTARVLLIWTRQITGEPVTMKLIIGCRSQEKRTLLPVQNADNYQTMSWFWPAITIFASVVQVLI